MMPHYICARCWVRYGQPEYGKFHAVATSRAQSCCWCGMSSRVSQVLTSRPLQCYGVHLADV